MGNPTVPYIQTHEGTGSRTGTGHQRGVHQSRPRSRTRTLKQHRGEARRSARVVKLRLVQKVKKNHVAFLSDVDEQEVEHELELVHVEQLRV